jgi:amino acid permease
MVGATMMVLPILFERSGILGGLIVMTISGFISAKTNSIYVEHNKE